MSGVRVGQLSLAVLLAVLLVTAAGCAWRTEFPTDEPETKAMAADCVEQGEFDGLEKRVTKLEGTVADNQAAIKEARMTADKALKCCRKEYAVVYSEELYFGFNSSALAAESHGQLDKVAGKLKEDPDYIIEIAGHTDAVGNTEYNIVLGQKRADAVRAYLVDKHRIAFSRIAIRSGGEAEPIASNESDGGRSKNRRATISVLGYATE